MKKNQTRYQKNRIHTLRVFIETMQSDIDSLMASDSVDAEIKIKVCRGKIESARNQIKYLGGY